MKAILLAGFLVLAATPALAHSGHDTTAPGNGAVLAEAPPHVIQTFAKRIRLTRVRLTHGDRAPADLGLGDQKSFATRFVMPLTDKGSGLRQATMLAVLALLASGIGFALKGAAMTGEASGMTDPEMLGLVWQTPAGTALVLRVAGLALILVGLRIPGIGLPVAAGGGILALWSFSRVGHVADAEPFWLEFLLLLHLAGAAFWIGILSPLRTIASDRESLSLAASLGHRFGRIAAFTVPVLIAAGIVMAWRLLGEVTALVATGYGLTLLAKIGAVACLLAAAAANILEAVRTTAEWGLLEEIKAGRENLYINPPLLTLLSERA